MTRSRFLLPLVVATSLASTAVAQYPRAGFEAFLDGQGLPYGVGGTATIVDADTILFEDFTYNGTGISVFFYLAATDNDAAFASGLPIGPQLVGQVFNGSTFTVDLPTGETLDAYGAISVWCVAAGLNFGSGAFLQEDPETYCTAKTNSLGCTPAIGTSGLPSATSGSPFLVTANTVLNNKNGLLFHGFTGPSNTPFLGGTLCVMPPLRRNAIMNSGGNPPPNDCSGQYTVDFNALIQGGGDPLLVPGQSVHAQYWTRDPGIGDGSGAGLSDATSFFVGP